MNKQEVSDELLKLIRLNKDSLGEIKNESTDIYNNIANIMVAMDKLYGGLNLTNALVDQEIGSITTATPSNLDEERIDLNAESKATTPPPTKTPTPKIGLVLPPSKDFKDDLLFPLPLNSTSEYASCLDMDGVTRYYYNTIGYNPDKIGTMKGGVRPSPTRSASAGSLGEYGVGNDGQIYVIKADKKGVQKWQKADNYSSKKFSTIEAFRTAMKDADITKEEDIVLANTIARYLLAITDKNDDDIDDIRRDVKRLQDITRNVTKNNTLV